MVDQPPRREDHKNVRGQRNKSAVTAFWPNGGHSTHSPSGQVSRSEATRDLSAGAMRGVSAIRPKRRDGGFVPLAADVLVIFSPWRLIDHPAHLRFRSKPGSS